MQTQGTRFRRYRRRHKVLGLFRMFRLQNLLLLLLSQVLVAWRFSTDAWWLDPDLRVRMLALVAATLCSAAGGYVINDYYDVKIDILNKPSKVVVGKLVSRRKSMVAHLLLFFLALCCGFLAGRKVLMLVFFCSSWLWLYSNQLKRLPFIGNFSIAVLTSVAIFLPAVLIPVRLPELILFACFAFWSTLIREIIKDVEDMRGDQRHGCRTLPIVFGIPATRRILYGCGILFLSTILFASLELGTYWRFASVGLALPLYLFYRKLSTADTRQAFSSLSRQAKWIMAGGTLSMLLV